MKTKMFKKSRILLSLFCLLIVSAVLGFVSPKTVKADPVTAPASFDYFKPLNGDNIYGTGTIMSYGDAKILYGSGRPLTNAATTKAFMVKFENTIKEIEGLEWYTVPATLVFRKAIDLSSTDNLITMGWFDDNAADTTAFGGNEFVVKVVDTADASNYITFQAGFRGDGEGYNNVKAGYAGSELFACSEISAWGSTLKSFELSDEGVLQFESVCYEDGFKVYPLATPMVDLKSKGWAGFTNNTAYVEVYVADGGNQLAITQIGQYDLSDPSSPAYDAMAPAALTETPDSYDYFALNGATLDYGTSKVIYGARPSTTKDYLNSMVANFAAAGNSFTFTKTVDLSKTDNLATIAMIDDAAVEPYDHGHFNDYAYTITVTDAKDSSKYITLEAKYVASDHMIATVSHSGMATPYVKGDMNGGIANSGSNIFGWELSDAGVLKARKDSYDGYKFYRVAAPDQDIYDLTTADPAWTGFTGNEVYVTISAAQASSLAVLSIGEYDLTDVNSPAYDEIPLVKPASYDHFAISNGSYDYAKAGVLSNIEYPSYDGTKINYTGLVLNFESGGAFTFGVPIDYTTDSPMIDIAMLGENYTSLMDKKFQIVFADATDPTKTLTIEPLVHGEVCYYVKAGHSGMGGVLLGKNVNNNALYGNVPVYGCYVANYGGYVPFGGANTMLRGFGINENGEVYAQGITDNGTGLVYTVDERKIINLKDDTILGENTWVDFTGKVYVTIIVEEAMSLLVTKVGTYDLTSNACPAYTHNMSEWIEEVAATCSANGTKGHYHCSVCGKDYDAEGAEMTDIAIVAGHTYGEWIAEVAATCTVNGTLGHYHCSVCNKDFDSEYAEMADLTIAAGHDIVHHEAKAPTCTEAGWEAYDTCNNCDYTTYEAVLALGHALTKVERVEATEEADGHIAYYTCSACNKLFSDENGEHEITLEETIIPKTGNTESTPTSESESEPESTTSETTVESEKTSSGCGSSLGATLFAIPAMLFAGIVLKKRKEEE